MTAPAVGTLNWKPAGENPELLAKPVREALDAQPVEVFVAPIDADLADTAAFCAAYQVGLEVSANCVVVAGRRGETTTLAACLVLATDRADVNRTIRKHLDARKISFAAVDEATSATGMEFGGITPLGLPAGWALLVDRAVADTEWVVIGSGLRSSKLLLRGADTAALPGAEVLDLALP